jgi:hypothetical protein
MPPESRLQENRPLSFHHQAPIFPPPHPHQRTRRNPQ